MPTSLSQPAYGSNPAHSLQYAYDDAGRTLYESEDGRQVSCQYDQAGNRSRLNWPDSYAVSYDYDLLSRMDRVTASNRAQHAGQLPLRHALAAAELQAAGVSR